MFIDLARYRTEELKEFDMMMVEAVGAVRARGRARDVWSAALRELHSRGEVTLVSGSFDDMQNAHVRRNWLEFG